MIGQETEYRRTYASGIPRNILGFKKEHFVNLFAVEKYQKYGIFLALSQIHRQAHLFI